MEKTFVCGHDYPCIGHKPDRQDSAKVSLQPVKQHGRLFQ